MTEDMPSSMQRNGSTEKEPSESPQPSHRLFHFDELPGWLQVDHYVRTGYRGELRSIQACLWSLTYLHNESVNLSSHLLPGLLSALYVLVGNTGLGVKAPEIAASDVLIVRLYILGTAVCWCLSVSGTKSYPNSPLYVWKSTLG